MWLMLEGLLIPCCWGWIRPSVMDPHLMMTILTALPLTMGLVLAQHWRRLLTWIHSLLQWPWPLVLLLFPIYRFGNEAQRGYVTRQRSVSERQTLAASKAKVQRPTQCYILSFCWCLLLFLLLKKQLQQIEKIKSERQKCWPPWNCPYPSFRASLQGWNSISFVKSIWNPVQEPHTPAKSGTAAASCASHGLILFSPVCLEWFVLYKPASSGDSVHLLITFTEPADGAESTVLSVDLSQKGEKEASVYLFNFFARKWWV